MRLALAVLLLATSSSLAQQAPEASPGLPLGSGHAVWALDVYEGKPELVPVHRENVELNRHVGKNVAGGLAGSVFYRPKMTTEVAGTEAQTALHSAQPSIFVHSDGEEDGPTSYTFALLPAKVANGKRVLEAMSFNSVTQRPRNDDGAPIPVNQEKLAAGWTKLTPVAPLPAGEYAVVPVMHQQGSFATEVYTLGIRPGAPEDADARHAAANTAQ